MMWNVIALAEDRWLSESFYINAGLKEPVGFSITGNFVPVCWTWLDETQQCNIMMCENVICKKQWEIAYNKRGSAGKCFNKTTARIVFLVMVKGRFSLLLSPRNSGSREQSYDFLCWSEREQIAAFSTGKKKLAVICLPDAQRSVWSTQIASNCSISICKKTSHDN